MPTDFLGGHQVIKGFIRYSKKKEKDVEIPIKKAQIFIQAFGCF